MREISWRLEKHPYDFELCRTKSEPPLLGGGSSCIQKTLNPFSLNFVSTLFDATGYHPEKRGFVCQEIKKLTNVLPKKSQIAYIHKIDKTLFMHGGLANLFVQLRVAPQNRKNVLAAVKAMNLPT